jgi:hypothetical protein
MNTIEAWRLGNHKSRISFWDKSADVRMSAQDISFTFGGTHSLADVNSNVLPGEILASIRPHRPPP